ncbi:MAG: ABC transporter permease, partial [Nanoarchaeota archaeon]|nr:ABC transporter permease [Nanoarchaeota archaeon]MBU1854412.1 ABC transporter permease [Nanoarchaeota archaeon]
MLVDTFLMSLRNLKRRRLRSWLTMIGIFIGIAAVVSLISLGEGLEKVITSQFSIMGADVIMITADSYFGGAPGEGVINPLTTNELDAVNRVSEIDFAIGRVIEISMVEFNNKVNYKYIGSFSGDNRMYSLVNIEVNKGRLLKSGDTKKVLAGSDFADNDGFYEKPVMVGSNILIKGVSFEVVGITKKKGSFILDSTITMMEQDIRELFDTPKEEYDGIATKVKNKVDLSEAKTSIEKSLRKVRDVKVGEEDFSVETNESAQKQLQSTLFGVQLFVYIIAGISIVVGGLGIMNTMYTSVLERRRDIGIMKAIGARNKDIFSLFFIESGLLGTIGGLIGLLLGVSLAKGLSFLG